MSALGMYAAAQDATMPAGWSETKFPTSSSGISDELRCANYSENEWRVTVETGAVHVSRSSNPEHPTLPPHFTRTDQMRGRSVVAKAGDGWLVGFDAGEFGGGLWWTSNDGREKKKLTDENVHAILARQAELLVFTGLAHMSIDEGRVYSYRPASQSVGTLVEVADLGSAPNAALVESNDIVLVAAQTRILALYPSNQLRVLYRNRDMGMLYTNSIAQDSAGNVVIGMRFFVLRLRPRRDGEYEPEWYFPDRCRNARVVGYHCDCFAHK